MAGTFCSCVKSSDQNRCQILRKFAQAGSDVSVNSFTYSWMRWCFARTDVFLAVAMALFIRPFANSAWCNASSCNMQSRCRSPGERLTATHFDRANQ